MGCFILKTTLKWVHKHNWMTDLGLWFDASLLYTYSIRKTCSGMLEMNLWHHLYSSTKSVFYPTLLCKHTHTLQISGTHTHTLLTTMLHLNNAFHFFSTMFCSHCSVTQSNKVVLWCFKNTRKFTTFRDGRSPAVARQQLPSSPPLRQNAELL